MARTERSLVTSGRRLYRSAEAMTADQDWIKLDSTEDVNEGDLLNCMHTGETVEVLRLLRGGCGIRRQYGFARQQPIKKDAEWIRGVAGTFPSYHDIVLAAAEKGISVGY